MDFKKKVIISVIVIFVLTATYILGVIFSPENVEKRKTQRLLYPGFKKSAVTKIVISNPSGSITLKKDSTNKWWVVLNNSLYPADSGKISDLLDEFTKLKEGKLISKNPKNWDNFDVVEKRARHFTFYDIKGKKIVDLLIGKGGIGGSGYYIRKSTGNNVYLISEVLSYYMNPAGDFWSYLKIMPKDLKVKDILKIVFFKKAAFDKKDKNPTINYTLYRGATKDKETVWKIEGKENLTLDEDKVNLLTSDLVDFEGVKFVTDKSADTGIKTGDTYFEITTQNNKTFKVYVGNKLKGKEQFYVKPANGKYTYVVSVWQLKRIFKPISAIEKKKVKVEKKENSKSKK